MSNLDAAQLATILESGYRLVSSGDYDGAYQLLAPVAESGSAAGADLARVNMYLGDACMGLASLDAAMQYYQDALAGADAGEVEYIRRRIADIGEIDSAGEAAADGIAGQDEASSALHAGMDALDRQDYSEARRWYEHAWNGIQMTDYQIAGAALGLFKCALHDGLLDEAEGYLQVAESRSPDHAETVAVYRQHLAERLVGATAGADGVDMTELDEIYRSAVAASYDGDHETARTLFEQMLDSGALPATDRGRVLRNLGVTHVYRQDYEAARAALTEAAEVGTAEVQQRAAAMLAQLDQNADASEIVAGIDLAAE